jgi:hypothetical protein
MKARLLGYSDTSKRQKYRCFLRAEKTERSTQQRKTSCSTVFEMQPGQRESQREMMLMFVREQK